MTIYENLTLDEERALYGIRGAQVKNCVFAGAADGESALKECRNLQVSDCRFELRYPLWHCKGGELSGAEMTPSCRAALWYDEDMRISRSRLHGIKALRECRNITLRDCDVLSQEFAWFCRNLDVQDVRLESEYPFMHSENLHIDGLKMKGKYSFQYVQNAVISHSVLDTKDAFWHSENVTVTDSVVKGEYLGWYSKNLRLVRCQIIGTQPLCYAQGLALEECTMQDTDLAFERSDVKADVRGEILSVKNPKSGWIRAEKIGEVIQDEQSSAGSSCRILCVSHAPNKEAVCL